MRVQVLRGSFSWPAGSTSRLATCLTTSRGDPPTVSSCINPDMHPLLSFPSPSAGEIPSSDAAAIAAWRDQQLALPETGAQVGAS